MKRAAVLLITLLAGCDLYFHGGGDDVVTCNEGAEGAPQEFDIRDPGTGVCNTFSDGGGCGETDANGCCIEPLGGGVDIATGPDCFGACDGLDENSCLATSGCHAAYQQLEANDPSGDPNGTGTIPTTFVSCWDIAPLAPLEGGGCANLDQLTCAEHDDCLTILDGFGGEAAPNGFFTACADEVPTTPPPDSCDGVDCGAGATCETQCYPCDPSNGGDGCMSSCGPVCVPTETCDTVDCGPGYTCAEGCDATGLCSPACYPTGGDPGSCTGNVTCNSAPPACPVNSTAGIEDGCYTGFCIPSSQCSAPDPGSCDPNGVMCNIAGPACPSGTVPGVSNGCWSGYCIPQTDCPIAACETLTTEASCEMRPDCTPVYNGSMCTCTADGTCTCESEAFARCASLGL